MYANLLKRAVDVVCALILLVVLSPLFVLVWFLARTDAGPAFFFQQRLGRGAAEFRIVKFRTMRVDADEQVLRKSMGATHCVGQSARGWIVSTFAPSACAPTHGLRSPR